MKVERVFVFGECRFRFWVNSFWFPRSMVSDGGLYRSIAEATDAAMSFSGKA